MRRRPERGDAGRGRRPAGPRGHVAVSAASGLRCSSGLGTAARPERGLPARRSLGCALPGPAQVSVEVLAKGAAWESGECRLPASPRLGREGELLVRAPVLCPAASTGKSGWVHWEAGSPRRVRGRGGSRAGASRGALEDNEGRVEGVSAP